MRSRSSALAAAAGVAAAAVLLTSGCVSDDDIQAVRQAAGDLRAVGWNAEAAEVALDRAAGDSADPGVRRAVDAVVPLLPPVVQGPAMLGAGLLIGLARARQLKKALRSVAEGIETVTREDPRAREVLDEHERLLEQKRTPTAARIVEEVRRGKPRGVDV
ncbi:MAG: hypothetical protein AAF108_01715 [Planctomycetota bacterium]